MSRIKLIKSVSAKTGIQQHHIKTVIDATLDEIASQMRPEKRYVIKGFGSFTLRRQPRRTVRNPRTGAAVVKEEAMTVKFYPSEQMLKCVQKTAPN